MNIICTHIHTRRNLQINALAQQYCGREIGTIFVVIICWSYLTQVLADMRHKHYTSQEVFCGIILQKKKKEKSEFSRRIQVLN